MLRSLDSLCIPGTPLAQLGGAMLQKRGGVLGKKD